MRLLNADILAGTVIQRDSDMLIAVGHKRLYFEKRSMSESIARVTNMVPVGTRSPARTK